MSIAEEMLIRSIQELGIEAPRALTIGGDVSLPIAVGHAVHGDGGDLTGTVWIPIDLRAMGDGVADEVDARRDLANPLSTDDLFDLVVLPVSPDRVLSRRWLVLAREHLAAHGQVILAGANVEGIKSVIGDAVTLFGNATMWETYRQKHRVARIVRGDQLPELPAWALEPGIAPGTWNRVAVPTNNDAVEDASADVLDLATLPGVFAGSRLDAGTAMLLANLEIVSGARVLDVGCGAGAIGLTASRRGAGSVDLCDVNLLAIAAVNESIGRLGVDNVRAFAADVYDEAAGTAASFVGKYDLIVSNPPFHQGKVVDHSMVDRLIDEAPKHLVSGGRLVIVANAFLAYGKQMERRFQTVRTVAATRRYHVLEAKHPR